MPGRDADGADATTERESLERAVAALEAQAAVLGADVVATAIAPMRERLGALTRGEEERRKQVTVVFADLVDFTVLSGELDPEDTRDVVDTYFARWQDLITAQGGTVEKFIGDAVMSVFGLHQSYEDDAARAVRAALAVRWDLAALNEQVRARHGITLRMRVGIDTGEVVVSTLGDRGAEFVAVGPTVNRAARLQAAAPVDGILISADTHRLVRGGFSMEKREALSLKGIGEPVTAYSVVSERPGGHRLERGRGVDGVETTTVGRDPDLRILQERLLDVVEDHRLCVVTVVGDAGLGKSRLLVDFDAWLAERPETFWWFRGRANPSSRRRAGSLLADAVATRVGIQDSDPPPVVRSKLRAGMERAFGEGEPARLPAQLLAAWLGLDTDDAAAGVPTDPRSLRDQASAVLAEYFVRLSGRATVVVMLEDLHWADNVSLRWLDTAAPALAESSVLVVATARPTFFDERPHWGEGLGHHLRLALDPLSARESRALLGQLLARLEDPPRALLDLVSDVADGNPFYLEEMVSWLLDAGVVARDGDRWRLTVDRVEEIPVPATLRGVLQARLDSLDPTQRRLLDRASVVGRVFWDEAVRALAEPGDGAVGPVLDLLRRQELVLQREASVFEGAREYLFRHALLRDVAYEGLLRSHRDRYHRQVAHWLETTSTRSGRQEEHAALIAEHLELAGDPDAARWYLRAGSRAARVYALNEATELLGWALELAPQDDVALRFDVLLAREGVLDRTGDRAAQRADLEAAALLVDSLPDDLVRHATYELARSRERFAGSEYVEAVEWAQRAVATSAAADRADLRAEACLWQGKAHTWSDEVPEAHTTLTVALELAEGMGRPDLVGESLRYLSMVANNEGDYAAAVDLGHRARTVFAAAGDDEAEAMALGQLSATAYNAGRPQEAREMLEQALPVFRRSGHRYRISVALANLAAIATVEGRLSLAEPWAEEAVQIVRELVDREATSTDLAILGQVRAASGDLDSARGHLLEALALATEVGAQTMRTDALLQLAFVELDARDLPAARRRAEEAVIASGRAVSPLQHGYAAMAAGYVALADDRPGEAETSFAVAEEDARALGLEGMEREAAAGHGAALAATGDVVAALALVAPLVEGLDHTRLRGTLRPERALLNAVRVLAVGGHSAADELAAAARRWVDTMADKAGEDRLRAGFLSQPAVVALLAATGAGGNS